MIITENEIGSLPIGALLAAIGEQGSEVGVAALKARRRAGNDEDITYLLDNYVTLRRMVLALCRIKGISYGMVVNE